MTVSKGKGIEPLISHHFNNIKYGNTATDERVNIQSVFSMEVQHPKLNKGKPTLIPSVYDGKVLHEDAAIKAAVDSGIKWTSADSHKELRKYDIEIHKRMSPSLGEKTDREAFGKGGTVQRNIKQPNETEYDMGDDVENPYPSQAQRAVVDKSINQPPRSTVTSNSDVSRGLDDSSSIRVGPPEPWMPRVDTRYLRPPDPKSGSIT